MKNKTSQNTLINATARLRRLVLFGSAVLLTLGCLASSARDDHARAGRYRQVNLVADLPGVALLQDTNLVNAWGVSFSGNSPFWISANGTGKATLYAVTNDASGSAHVSKLGLEVTIPGDGNPTGQVFNNLGGFNGDIFIFASEDGTISGWRGALGTSAETLVPPSTAVYKGITLATNMSGPLLLAANFRNGSIDEFDGSLALVGQFSDPRAPAGYAPFNVQSVAGMVIVTFAKQDAAKHDDVSGVGNGLIDVFNPQTGKFHRFATGSAAGGRLRDLNSPWGVAVAPGGFGEHGDQLLVGNFGSGTIMAFEADGDFQGLLQNLHGGPVVIDGLWAITFGNGGKAGVPNNLYFTSGPGGEAHGLFGSLEPAKERNGHDDDNQGDDD